MANPPTPLPTPQFTTLALLQLTLEATSLCYFYLGHLRTSSSSLSKIIQTTTEEFRVCHGVIIVIDDFASANTEFKKALGKMVGQVDRCMVDLRELVGKLKKRARRLDWGNVRKSVEGWKELLLGISLVLEKSAKEGSQEPEVKARDYRSEATETYCQRRAERQELWMKIEASGSQPELASKEFPALGLEKYPAEIENKRQQILDRISPEIYSKKHIAIRGKRHGDIGAWILRSPDFLNWAKAKNDRNSQLLWGYGIAGSGKTFLSSIIVDHFLDIASIYNYGVAYIYFDHEEQSIHDTTSVLANIVRQLLSQLPVLPDKAGKLHEKCNPLKYDYLYNLFSIASSSFTNTFIICDALDECGKGEQRRSLLTLLCRMAGAANVFLTSRENMSGDIQNTLDCVPKVELRAREEDIKIYTEHMVDNSLLTNRLHGKGLYRERIVSDIGMCAKGMFLLVDFHVQHLCQQPSINQILHELKVFRSASSDQSPLILAYDRIVAKLRMQSLEQRMLVLRIFTWLAGVNRTLTFKELQHAISIKQGIYEFEHGNLTFQMLQDATSIQLGFELNVLDLPDRKTILSLCSGLVAIDEKTSKVQFVHSTTQEYLIKTSIVHPATDSALTIACASYLLSKAFSRGALIRQSEFEARVAAYPFLRYAAGNFMFHLGKFDNSLTKNLLLRFLKRTGTLSSYMQALDSSSDYPRNYLPLHFACSIGHLEVVQALLEIGVDITTKNSYGETAFTLAVANGHKEIVRLLLDKFTDCKRPHHFSQGKHIDDTQKSLKSGFPCLIQDDINTASPLSTPKEGTKPENNEAYAQHITASGGHAGVLEWLFNRFGGLCPERSSDWPMDMALANTAAAGHERVVEMLLKRGIPLSGESEVGQLSPLRAAAARCHLSTVKSLLQHSATPVVSCPRCLRFLSDDLRNEDSEKVHEKVTGGFCKCPSEMWEAASEGDFEKFRQMLDQGVDVLSQDERGCTAFHWAARNGHESIIRLLLEMHPEIDLSAQNHRKQTVLHLAAVCGHEKIVSLLLESVPGIGLVQDMCNFTAFHLAALKGHDSVVRVLLSKEPNTDHSKVNSHRQTALHLAASGGHATTVKLLLDNNYGIDPSARDINEYTALGWAVQGGHEEVVRLLLHKTEAESTNWQGGNLLHLAARIGHISIASLLIQQTPGLFVQNANGMTPLHIAAMKGHWKMICLLLESVTESEFSMKDRSGYTALHWAVQEGHDQIVQSLLQREHKIDFSAMITAGWQTVLHIAVFKGHEKTTQLLLEKISTCDLAIRNMRGYTALHLAVSCGHETIVRLLVERCPGAHLLVEEYHGYTALHLAAIRGHEGMVKFLLQKGPKVDISVLATSEFGEVMDDAEPSKGHEAAAALLLDNESVKNSCGLTAQKLAILKRRLAADNEKRRERKVSIPQSVSDAYA